jgi:hypothetical protein
MRTQLPTSSGPATEAKELEETILALLPFPEPKELFDRIRLRHPKCKIIYYTPDPSAAINDVAKYWKKDLEVPDGMYHYNSGRSVADNTNRTLSASHNHHNPSHSPTSLTSSQSTTRAHLLGGY